jgi:hypothetical protein
VLGFLLVLWWLRETMSFEEVFAMVCTGGETKKNFLISSSKMFGILGVAMDATTDLFFGLAVTGLVYLGPVVCAVFRSSAMMHQRSGDDDEYDENEDENNEHNLKIIDGMFRFLFGHHRENAERYGRLVPIRDVLLAPFFEEFVFRGLLLTVLLGTGFDEGTRTTSGSAAVSTRSAVYVSPLFFGFAHINHYFALKKVYGSAKASRFVLFQCIYTTAFGALAGTIFWRCKAGLAGAWSLHASMNAFGVPDFRPFRRKTNAFEPPHFRRGRRNNSDDYNSGGVKGKHFNAKIINWLERICYVLGPLVAREFVRSRIVV